MMDETIDLTTNDEDSVVQASDNESNITASPFVLSGLGKLYQQNDESSGERKRQTACSAALEVLEETNDSLCSPVLQPLEPPETSAIHDNIDQRCDQRHDDADDTQSEMSSILVPLCDRGTSVTHRPIVDEKTFIYPHVGATPLLQIQTDSRNIAEDSASDVTIDLTSERGLHKSKTLFSAGLYTLKPNPCTTGFVGCSSPKRATVPLSPNESQDPKDRPGYIKTGQVFNNLADDDVVRDSDTKTVLGGTPSSNQSESLLTQPHPPIKGDAKYTHTSQSQSNTNISEPKRDGESILLHSFIQKHNQEMAMLKKLEDQTEKANLLAKTPSRSSGSLQKILRTLEPLLRYLNQRHNKERETISEAYSKKCTSAEKIAFTKRAQLLRERQRRLMNLFKSHISLKESLNVAVKSTSKSDELTLDKEKQNLDVETFRTNKCPPLTEVSNAIKTNTTLDSSRGSKCVSTAVDLKIRESNNSIKADKGNTLETNDTSASNSTITAPTVQNVATLTKAKIYPMSQSNAASKESQEKKLKLDDENFFKNNNLNLPRPLYQKAGKSTPNAKPHVSMIQDIAPLRIPSAQVHVPIRVDHQTGVTNVSKFDSVIDVDKIQPPSLHIKPANSGKLIQVCTLSTNNKITTTQTLMHQSSLRQTRSTCFPQPVTGKTSSQQKISTQNYKRAVPSFVARSYATSTISSSSHAGSRRSYYNRQHGIIEAFRPNSAFHRQANKIPSRPPGPLCDVKQLIDDRTIEPGENVLSLHTSKKTYFATLLPNGYIKSGGKFYKTAVGWYLSIPANKGIPMKKQVAYQKIMYKGKPLLQWDAGRNIPSRVQGIEHKEIERDISRQSSNTPCISQSKSYSLVDILQTGLTHVINDREFTPNSSFLPKGFWDSMDLPSEDELSSRLTECIDMW